MGLYLREKSKTSFTWGAIHNDSLVSDTLYRIDMQIGGNEVTPTEALSPLDELANYYLGSASVEEVKAYQRVVYEDVADYVDAHFYYGRTGPRMAIVVHPGGSPADAKLRFTGHDSINVDWQGALKVYLGEKWVKLDQAMAFQVNDDDEIVPVNWTATYQVDAAEVTAGFVYESYNPAWPLVLEIGYPALMPGGGVEQRNLNWSTYSGGQGGDELECVEVDEQGNPYVCGYVTGIYFPIAEGYTVHTPFVSYPTGYWSAVIMKIRALDKVTEWATYYGGYDGGKWTARTKAHKLTVDDSQESSVNHVFVTGSTNCTDFDVDANQFSVFSDAFVETYDGGIMRMWLGAFRKANGIRDWATTHGESGDVSWCEHGLAIAVDEEGTLVVGGQIETFDLSAPATPDFPLVTPGGAFSRSIGGGYYIVFDSNYQILWSTTFGEFEHDDAFTKVTDLRITRMNGPVRKVIWLVGTSAAGTSEPLDTEEISGAFFQDEGYDYSPMIARIDISDQYRIEYCTRWGSGEAYGVELTDKNLWVVGYGGPINEDQCPNPGGSGVHHQNTPLGTTFGQATDGFILRFTLSPFDLDYGTVIGGLRDDILLDVNSSGGSRVFITGETRSAEGFGIDLNANYYFQQQYDYWNRRDAFILSLSDNPSPAMLWRTAFGGSQSDRGWGIAASSDEVYLVGATASQQTDAFPLWDFDPNSDLDLYQEWNLGGNTNIPVVPFYQFCGAMNHTYTGFGWPEGLNTPHDGFIASFGSQLSVGISEMMSPPSTEQELVVMPIIDGSTWFVQFPGTEPWRLEVVDMAGRIVQRAAASSQRIVVDLRGEALGLYALRASNGVGEAFRTKLHRQ